MPDLGDLIDYTFITGGLYGEEDPVWIKKKLTPYYTSIRDRYLGVRHFSNQPNSVHLVVSQFAEFGAFEEYWAPFQKLLYFPPQEMMILIATDDCTTVNVVSCLANSKRLAPRDAYWEKVLKWFGKEK